MKKRGDFLDVLYTRRSYRKFLDKKVSKKVINELLNSAIMAPSAKNTQPWNFTIVEGKENISKIGERVFEKLKNKKPTDNSFFPRKPEHIFYNAPLLVVISGKKDYSWLKEDISLACQNMMLTANYFGLGSCWIGFANVLNNDENSKKKLGIPKDFQIVSFLIFGYYKQKINAIPKRKIKILKWVK